MNRTAELLRRHRLLPKKRWGQCFLHERHVVERIVELATINAQGTVLEIGPGLGALTELLCRQARKVVAVEIDPQLVALLGAELAHLGNLELVESDILRFDLACLPRPYIVVGNLPYNVSTAVLFRLLEHRQCLSTAVLMFQKEVARRLTARPDTADYGVPSVLVQFYTRASLCFDIGAGAFIPPPRVDSAVVRIEPKADCEPPRLFESVVRTAFATRRKTLRRALCRRFPSEVVEAAIAHLPPAVRGEQLSVDAFVDLARRLESRPGQGRAGGAVPGSA